MSINLIPKAVLVAALLPATAYSQSGSAEGVVRIIEQAREAGVPIILLDEAVTQPAAEPDGTLPLSEHAMHLASTISANFHGMLVDLAAAPETLPAVVAAAAPGAGAAWLWWAVLTTVLCLLAGWGVEQALSRLAVAKATPPPAGAPRSAHIRFMLLTTIVEGLLIAIGLVVALLLVVSLGAGEPHHRTVVLAIFEAVVIVRFLLIFDRSVLVEPSLQRQLLRIPPESGARAYAMLRAGLWAAGALGAIAFWLERIGAAEGLIIAAIIVTATAAAAVLVRTIWFLQPQMGLGWAEPGRRTPFWLRYGHLIATVYFVAAVLVTAFSRLAEIETGWLVLAPVAGAILAAISYAASLLIVDKAFSVPEETVGAKLPSFRDWGERTALTFALVVATCAVLGAWDVDFFRDDGSVRSVYAILLVLVLAYVGWSAIQTAFDRRIAAERLTAGPELEEREEGGVGGTRLATLLPLFRNATLIAVLVLASMVMLSAIGVDIAPLFAGAGLVGIAIGFGAQTLVRDIFSGVFFLIDDAFRVGEYIETGGARGTVEKISIRSMQLRHQNGPLHTIPFGEITQLTNFSRDWVIMKLPIRVRFGTDTERVRKLIKKLGQELLEHPVIGDKFVEPLKSQGVYQMDEFGIVTRVKFKTKPGDQFAVRKVVYQKITELFEREGIAFGGREVIVRAAAGGDQATPSANSPDVAAAALDASDREQDGSSSAGKT